jgi:hypothetical protein
MGHTIIFNYGSWTCVSAAFCLDFLVRRVYILPMERSMCYEIDFSKVKAKKVGVVPGNLAEPGCQHTYTRPTAES